MEALKDLKESISAKTNVSRRSFLKGLGALSASAALYGCGGGGSPQSLLGTQQAGEQALQPPPITETVIPGAAPHNCGGRCVTKAYVQNGVITRFVTDERPDLTVAQGDDPQLRACVRCRSYKQRLYRPDRILYPMKQTKTRGDLTGFVRIPWSQAFSEIAAKTQSINSQYGAASFLNIYASADPGLGGYVDRFFNLLGGSLSYRQDYSWPSIEHMSWFTLGQANYYPVANSRDDFVKNSNLILIWSHNPSELIWGTNSMWYLQQARSNGAKIIAVDSRQTDTVATLADQHIPVYPGTDPALILAMMYVMLTQGLLDPTFVKTYVHGFFDDPAPTLYHSDVNPAKYYVPAGASLASYIMGNNPSAAHPKYAGLISASIYPNNLYYNVNSTDVLYGKSTFCYGQTPKTPQWAASITGVSVNSITALATQIASSATKTSIIIGGGFQRQSEGEQSPWLINVLAGITGNFGQPGRMFGIYGNRTNFGYGPGLSMPSGTNAAPGQMASFLYDMTKLTAPNYTPAVTRTSIPVFLWSDAVNYGGTGQSEWNDGQIKSLKVGVKCIYNFAGNMIVNQDGDCNKKVSILTDTTKLQLIVTAEQCMTASAAYSDYVLPASMHWEKNDTASTWATGDSLLYLNQAIQPPGQCMQDYYIVGGIASQLGLSNAYTNNGTTVEQWIQTEFNSSVVYNPDLTVAPNPTFANWQSSGIYVYGDGKTFVNYTTFRTAPAANPLGTPSGKIEAYAQSLVEDYSARHYNNLDSRTTLLGPLHDGSTSGRFVYPIPMYIPMVEGKHADGSQPDPSGFYAAGYTYTLMAAHNRYRSHSTHNNNAFLDQFYKGSGQSTASPYNNQADGAFLNPIRPGYGVLTNGTGYNAVWDDGVYEPVWINPSDANQLGITDGMRVLIHNARGQVYAIAQLTNKMRPGVLTLGQGGWYNGNGTVSQVDVGGCANTLTKRRPARIGQGMTLGCGDTLVAIAPAPVQ